MTDSNGKHGNRPGVLLAINAETLEELWTILSEYAQPTGKVSPTTAHYEQAQHLAQAVNESGEDELARMPVMADGFDRLHGMLDRRETEPGSLESTSVLRCSIRIESRV